MAYSFVGSANNDAASPAALSINISTISPGTLQNGDVAYIVLGGGLGTTGNLPSWVPPTGWLNVGNALRNKALGTGSYKADAFEHTCDGTETTITFTDSNATSSGTHFIAVVVYRGLNAIGVGWNQVQDPVTTTTDLSPWTEAQPTAVVCTIPTLAHSLGTTAQALLYFYFDANTGVPVTRDSTDSNLIERLALEVGGGVGFLGWWDEPWATTADLPSRAVSTHRAGGAGTHRGAMCRMYPTISQGITADGGDHWAHAEGSDDMDSWQLVG